MSQHILPTSATMVGVCITVVGLVRLLEGRAPFATVIDNVVAIDAVVFLSSAVLSYAALRTSNDTIRLERTADMLFLGGLVILSACGIMLAWEIGQTPVPVIEPATRARHAVERPAGPPEPAAA